jgi:hypothetical protein
LPLLRPCYNTLMSGITLLSAKFIDINSQSNEACII